MSFSYYKNLVNVKSPSSVELSYVHSEIVGGELLMDTLAVREADPDDKDAKSKAKKRLPAVSFAGNFTQRGNKYLTDLSGLICLDIDELGKWWLPELRSEIINDDTLLPSLVFISPSGQGLKVVCEYNNDCDASYREIWDCFEKYFLEKYEIQIDKACKDVSRLCYLCADDTAFYREQKSLVKIEKKAEKVPKKTTKKAEKSTPNTATAGRILQILKQKDLRPYQHHHEQVNVFLYQKRYGSFEEFSEIVQNYFAEKDIEKWLEHWNTEVGESDETIGIGTIIKLLTEKGYETDLPEHDELIGIRDYFTLDDFIVATCKNADDVRRVLDLIWSDANLQKTPEKIFKEYNHRYQNAKKTADNWRVKANDKLDYLVANISLNDEIKTKRLALDKVRSAFDKQKFVEVRARLLEAYNFSKDEIEMIDYFISQSKQPTQDPSRNIALLFFSDQRTGKSTVARAFCQSLNGTLVNHKSTLSRELQFRNFDKPFAIQNNCTLMDEVQFKDMHGIYGTLKEILTSNSCSVEYKFKNELLEFPCRRMYIFCTNKHPKSVIKEEKERRFAVINFNNKIKKQLTENEVFDLWHEYICAVNYEKDLHSERYAELLAKIWYAGEESEIVENCREMVDIYLSGVVGRFSLKDVMIDVMLKGGERIGIKREHVRQCIEQYRDERGAYYKQTFDKAETQLPF